MSGRPIIKPVMPRNIPAAMAAAENRWAHWTYVQNDKGKWTKPCTNPLNGRLLSTNTSWWGFGQCLASLDKAMVDHAGYMHNPAGLGFLMTQEPKSNGGRMMPERHNFVLIDLDHCVTDDDQVADWAREILDRCGDTYVEISPSGTGLRVVGYAPPGSEDRREFTARNKKTGTGCELYFGKEARYLTMTGRILEPELGPAEVKEISGKALDWLTATHGTTISKAPALKDFDRPELLDAERAKQFDMSGLPDDVVAFMTDGVTPHGDRSRMVQRVAIEVLKETLNDKQEPDPQLALTVLANNTFVMGTALDHRQQSEERALTWLWQHHVASAMTKAVPSHADDFEEFEAPEISAMMNNPHRDFQTGNISLAEFYADGPSGRYICSRNSSLWANSSIDKRFPTLSVDKKNMLPSTWLHRTRGVDGMSWIPGKDMIVENQIMIEGELVKSEGASLYNLYRPSMLESGDASQAGPWIDHVRKLYPAEADHLLKWFAFKAQHPGRKINHAIVLGGGQGIGKDSLLAPVIATVGKHNTHEISPAQVFERFNHWQQSVILRVSEARDLGPRDRYRFYESMKALLAAPPATLPVERKYMDGYEIPNVVGVVFTTNYTGALYLPADDRRHFVAGSNAVRGENGLVPSYFDELWGFYESGGLSHVAAYLRTLPLGGFDPNAPPPDTEAKALMTDSSLSDEERVLDAIIDEVGLLFDPLDCDEQGRPYVLTVGLLERAAERIDEAGGDEDSMTGAVATMIRGKKLELSLERFGYIRMLDMVDKSGRYRTKNGAKVRPFVKQGADRKVARRILDQL